MDFHITISGWDAEKAESEILSRVVSQFTESLEQRIDDKVSRLVNEAAQKVITKRIAAKVDEIVAEGWTEKTGNNYYDHPVKMTLKEKIEKALSTKDEYGRGNTLPGIVTSELRSKFDAEVKDGTKRLREKIDEVINSTIEETITGDIRAKIRKAIAC